jgi:hemolysin activation/secretion protein
MSLRGYHSYRFRANNVANFSTELQRTVRALTDVRGIDALVFVDTGQVWGDARSATDQAILDNQLFDAGKWRGGFGGGVQYRHSPKLAVRLDVGRSREETIFYVAFSRGF